MRPTLSLALLAALSAAPIAAQSEVLYYKFDAGDGGKVINYYSSTGLAPAEATITTTYPGGAAWAAGMFGAGALLGSHFDPANPTVRSSANYVSLDTGWVPNMTGSFTIAWFMKERAPLGTSLGYLFSNNGSFRGFYNGVAYRGFMVRAWGGAPADLTLNDPARPNPALPSFDVLAGAATKWLHVALVVDVPALTATYYIDGVALAPTIALTAPTNLVGTTPMLIGRHTSTGSSFMHDIDEFRFLLRAASPAEIKAWAARPEAAAGVYGQGCKGTLKAAKPPVVPSAFQMDITGPVNGGGFLSIGLSRTKFGALTMPLDLGLFAPGLKGCMWESDLTASAAFALDASGVGAVVLPIPKSSLFFGVSLYNQGILYDKALNLYTTNGLAMAMGL